MQPPRGSLVDLAPLPLSSSPRFSEHNRKAPVPASWSPPLSLPQTLPREISGRLTPSVSSLPVLITCDWPAGPPPRIKEGTPSPSAGPAQIGGRRPGLPAFGFTAVLRTPAVGPVLHPWPHGRRDLLVPWVPAHPHPLREACASEFPQLPLAGTGPASGWWGSPMLGCRATCPHSHQPRPSPQ